MLISYSASLCRSRTGGMLIEKPPQTHSGRVVHHHVCAETRFSPRWENGDPPNPLKRRSFKGRGGLGCGGARRSGCRVPPARGETGSESSVEVFTPSPALPPQRSGEITARGPAESAGNGLWPDPNQAVRRTGGVGGTRQPLLPAGVQERLLSSPCSLKRSCGGRSHWRHYGA